ncbi:YhgE/Pip domain-containing protein [Nocardia sp. CA-128927]|uniref:YhgE/Pip domain-containing protein n=1 Tax=Nocardia sp. CA-128927 TaxID=3239975 RepID=UPI003D96197F
MHATALLRSPKIWVFTLFGALLAVVLTVGYLGGTLNTDTPTQRVPIVWADTDQGNGTQNLGTVLTGEVLTGRAHEAAHWLPVTTEAQARELLTTGAAYAAVVIPADFTARVAALNDLRGGPDTVRVTVLTNPIAGPAASGTASGIAQAVLAELSPELRFESARAANLTAATADPGTSALVADPIRVTLTPVGPIPAHSAGGMAAFYYTLVLILTGFLLAQLLHSGVDGVLGFTPREFLHKRATHPPLPINRVHTLLAKTGLMIGCAVVAGTVIEAVAVLALGMPAQHPLGLWGLSVLAVATAGVLPLVLLAVFGAPGALVATIVLVVFGVPSSGGAYPPELQPEVFRWLGQILPMRHTTDAARDLIFPVTGNGVIVSVVAIALWLVAALAAGLAVTAFYDRTGRHRVSVDERARADRA